MLGAIEQIIPSLIYKYSKDKCKSRFESLMREQTRGQSDYITLTVCILNINQLGLINSASPSILKC